MQWQQKKNIRYPSLKTRGGGSLKPVIHKDDNKHLVVLKV